MPRLTPARVPSYRLHKQSGQALVTLNGKDHLHGAHGSPESREKYGRLIAEWEANGRRASFRRLTHVTCSMLIAEFCAHAQTYYPDRDKRFSPEAIQAGRPEPGRNRID